MRLTSTNPCSCLLLTQIPQGNHSRMEKGEWESSFWLRFEFCSLRVARERGWRGRRGYIYSSTPKEPLGEGVPGDSGYMPGDSGQPWLFSSETAPGHSGQWGPEYPALYPEYPGKTGINFQFMVLLSCFVDHKYLYRFSWAQDPNRNPWTKSLLIVRRSYTQISNSKSNFLSKLELRLFISFLRVVYHHLIHLYMFTTCTHAQLHN